MKALVSVIIPCYNAERWIGEAIQSCLDQTHQPMEVIVVDDGSTDRSQQIVSAVAKNANVAIKLIASVHKGASAARNQGLAVASGDYVQFLDADDLMSPRKIELQAVFTAHGHEAVPCGPWLWLRPSNERWMTEQPREHTISTDDLVHQWLAGNGFVVHCFLWPRKVVIELGGWDESLSIWQDTDLFIRAVFKGIQFCFVPESVVYYRTGHSSTSVSSGRTLDSLKSRIRVLNKVQAGLESRGDLQKYRTALARNHYMLARGFALDQPEEARECFGRFLQLSPDGLVPGTLANHLATRLLGVVKKERLARKLRVLQHGWTSASP
jgi:glycosyltransferase involved in cell wall biosynthesis